MPARLVVRTDAAESKMSPSQSCSMSRVDSPSLESWESSGLVLPSPVWRNTRGTSSSQRILRRLLANPSPHLVLNVPFPPRHREPDKKAEGFLSLRGLFQLPGLVVNPWMLPMASACTHVPSRRAGLWDYVAIKDTGRSLRPCWEVVAEKGAGCRQHVACPGAGLPSPPPACSSCGLATCHHVPRGMSPTPASTVTAKSQLEAVLLVAISLCSPWDHPRDDLPGACCHILPQGPCPRGVSHPSLPAVSAAALSFSSAHVSPAIKVSGEGKTRSSDVPKEGRERCLSLPLLQTLFCHFSPAVNQPLVSPSTHPVWMERCPKWTKETQKEKELRPQGPRSSSQGHGKMGAQGPFRNQS